MELNLDELRAARARERPSSLVVDGRTFALRQVLSVSAGLMLAEAQEAAKRGDVLVAVERMRSTVADLLTHPDEADDLMHAVEQEELFDLLGSFYPEAPGVSLPPSVNGGSSAKPTAPGTTDSISPPPVSVPTP